MAQGGEAGQFSIVGGLFRVLLEMGVFSGGQQAPVRAAELMQYEEQGLCPSWDSLALQFDWCVQIPHGL